MRLNICHYKDSVRYLSSLLLKERNIMAAAMAKAMKTLKAIDSDGIEEVARNDKALFECLKKVTGKLQRGFFYPTHRVTAVNEDVIVGSGVDYKLEFAEALQNEVYAGSFDDYVKCIAPSNWKGLWGGKYGVRLG